MTMQKIIVLNTKGGCGKTTVATSLAAHYAGLGFKTSLMDYDSQGSSMRWLSRRDEMLPRINGIAAFERSTRVTRSWQLRVPTETERMIIDTPAGLDPQRLTEITRQAHAVIVPVLPSDIDIHAASRCIADLLLVAKLDRRAERLCVIANRAKTRTRVFTTLTRFLDSLAIPFVTTLRDTQNYIACATDGVGIHELHHPRADQDRQDWKPLLEWLDSRPPVVAQAVPGVGMTGPVQSDSKGYQ